MTTVPKDLVSDFNRALERANDDLMGMQTRAYERGVQDGVKDLLARVREHWKDGVTRFDEEDDTWHGTMRDILDEAARAAGGE
jgi:hypothetical protein